MATSPFNYKPEKLYEAIPLYFRREYGGPGDQPGPLPDGVFDMRLDFLEQPLIIYGYAVVSTFPEDRQVERSAWVQRKVFLSNCFSEVCQDGELGFTPVEEVTEITREEFEKARENGWK